MDKKSIPDQKAEDLALRNILIEAPEDWKSLSFLGFPNNYVSKYGDVITTNRRGWNRYAFLSIVHDKDGYCTVNLNYQSRKQNFKVHRLVALCFIPNPMKLPQVNHKRGDKDDNRYTELEWCTNQENALHLHRQLEDYSARFTRMQDILADYNNGSTQAEICRKYNVSATYVHRICVKGDVSIAR